jgi:hypothetical protein
VYDADAVVGAGIMTPDEARATVKCHGEHAGSLYFVQSLQGGATTRQCARDVAAARSDPTRH